MSSSGQKTVLRSGFAGGPHGLGDPNDTSLRKVEVDVMVPKKMRELAKIEKCAEEVKNFSNCCKHYNLLMVVTCRKENSALKDCLTRWYHDEEFKERCKKVYLEERSEYRRTGISKSQRRVPSQM